MKIFNVHDSKAQAYLRPFFEKTAGLAVRAFETAARDTEHAFNKYPGDYTLFEVGNHDEETGIITGLATHINLGKALDYIGDTTS